MGERASGFTAEVAVTWLLNAWRQVLFLVSRVLAGVREASSICASNILTVHGFGAEPIRTRLSGSFSPARASANCVGAVGGRARLGNIVTHPMPEVLGTHAISVPL